MKHLICLLAAASVFFAANAVENTPGEASGDTSSSQYSEKGYKRPGKPSQPKFTEKFLNSGKESPEETESEDASNDSPETTAPVTETESPATDSDAGKTPAGKDTPIGYSLDNDIADLVKQACKLGVFVIRQPYGVTDGTTDYELEEGKLEVGVTYAPAYYIRGGYLFTDLTLSPWNHDPAFHELVEPGMTGKLIGATTSADLSTGAEYDSIPFNPSSRGNVYPGLLYSMRDNSAFASDGFYASSEPGDQEGYIVWIIKSPSQDLSADTDLMITATRKPMKVEDDPAKQYPLGRGVTNAVGALYVTPEITGVGRVDLYLQGVGVEDDGQWSLIFPFRSFSKIFDKEQAVKAPAEDSDRKPGRLRKVLRPKAPASKVEAPVATEPEVETPRPDATDGPAPKTDGAKPDDTDSEADETEDSATEE